MILLETGRMLGSRYRLRRTEIAEALSGLLVDARAGQAARVRGLVTQNHTLPLELDAAAPGG